MKERVKWIWFVTRYGFFLLAEQEILNFQGQNIFSYPSEPEYCVWLAQPDKKGHPQTQNNVTVRPKADWLPLKTNCMEVLLVREHKNEIWQPFFV